MKSYSDSEFFDAPFRGVTSVLNAIFGNKFENSGIPEHILIAAGERGTAVHKYIEEWLNWYDRPFKKEDTLEPFQSAGSSPGRVKSDPLSYIVDVHVVFPQASFHRSKPKLGSC